MKKERTQSLIPPRSRSLLWPLSFLVPDLLGARGHICDFCVSRRKRTLGKGERKREGFNRDQRNLLQRIASTRLSDVPRPIGQGAWQKLCLLEYHIIEYAKPGLEGGRDRDVPLTTSRHGHEEYSYSDKDVDEEGSLTGLHLLFD